MVSRARLALAPTFLTITSRLTVHYEGTYWIYLQVSPVHTNIVIAAATVYTGTLNGKAMEDDKCMDEKETSRLEAFSDGVFAVAITLLVLNIKIPPDNLLDDQHLWDQLLHQWPMLLAFVTSFATVGIMWTMPLHRPQSC